MKKLLVLFLFALPFSALAQESATTLEAVTSNWSTEAHLNSISNSTSATFGPSLLYNFADHHQIGLRFLAPFGGLEDGTESLMALYRFTFGQNQTNLFSELTVGGNWYYSNGYRTREDNSIGTNLGIMHHLNNTISLGGLAGIEWTQTEIIDGIAVSKSVGAYPWGRIAIFGSLIF